MVGASRMMGRSRALHSDQGLPASPSSCGRPSLRFPWRGGKPENEKTMILQGRKRPAVSLNTSVISPPERQYRPSSIEEGGIGKGCTFELPYPLLLQVVGAAVQFFGLSQFMAAKISWRLQVEVLVERGVIGCQSFTLLAVAGSLIGSILCFVQGCFLVLESFVRYFPTIAQSSDQAGVIRVLIEAIDMFLVGSALLTFGMGLYVMFAGSDEMKRGNKGCPISKSNIKRLPASMEIQSLSHAKSKLGHAMMLILQAGVLDKFKTVPVSTCLDLACFAGAVLISSSSIFILSKLTVHKQRKSCDASSQLIMKPSKSLLSYM